MELRAHIFRTVSLCTDTFSTEFAATVDGVRWSAVKTPPTSLGQEAPTLEEDTPLASESHPRKKQKTVHKSAPLGGVEAAEESVEGAMGGDSAAAVAAAVAAEFPSSFTFQYTLTKNQH